MRATRVHIQASETFCTYMHIYSHMPIDGETLRRDGRICSWVHSSVVRAADCRSAGPWFKSGCALVNGYLPMKTSRMQWLRRHITNKTNTIYMNTNSIYVYVHICKHMYIYICIYVYIYVYMKICKCMYLFHIYRYLYMYMAIGLHTSSTAIFLNIIVP